MLHGRQFDQSELLAVKPHLIKSLIEAMRTLAIYAPIIAEQCMKRRKYERYLVSGWLKKYCDCYIPQCIEQLFRLFCQNITFGVSSENEETRNYVAKMSNKYKFTQEDYQYFKRLWDDPWIKEVFFYHQDKFHMIDSAEYLFETMYKFCHQEYIPTFKDLLHSNQRTTGVNKMTFRLKDNQEIYEIFDAGGQRNERKKWHYFFANTTAVIFVASIASYNQSLWEDSQSNRMRESLGLFRAVINLNVLKDSHFIFFFNKLDLFEKKVGKHLVHEYFKDFQGKEVCHEIIDYFIQKFKEQRREKKGQKQIEIHFHVTCALDTWCMMKTFNSSRNVIIRNELGVQGFL